MVASLWNMPQLPVHIALHILLPLAVAAGFWRPGWVRAAAVMWACNLVDLDHLLATPVYDAHRVSIGFHPLHSYWAIAVYALVAVLAPRSSIWRLIAVGLLLHMAVDSIDALVLQ